jgi:hypothetical protein
MTQPTDREPEASNPDDESDSEIARGAGYYHYTRTVSPLPWIPNHWIEDVEVITKFALPWLGTAAAGGIVGNLAYDIVKSLVARLKDNPPDWNKSGEEYWDVLVKQTVRARCAELDWPIPAIDSLHVTLRVNPNNTGTRHYFVKGVDMEAEVVIQSYRIGAALSMPIATIRRSLTG